MPDMERVIDQLRVDMARTPLDRAWSEGYVAGKRQARKEVVILSAFVALVVVFLSVWVAA
ncbi:MAG: hypothetical protein LC131_06905 [Anaerolineae bacterium]|nr:hypothetical protein [Anaerolineae bacterium]GIK44897.1 MAG: hypothetical protein BroJett012_08000 [Betaproteobacteria bacterium]